LVGALLDAVASPDDRLWPKDRWPRIGFDRPLGVGASGGHGPISYVVEEYVPGQLLKCRFLGPRGFDGHHWLEVVPRAAGAVVLRHTIRMQARGMGLLIWAFVVRPMHDALIEDALARAQATLGFVPEVRPWSLWVRLLRWTMTGGRARTQAVFKQRANG
jgi:hypothetical protein